MTDLGEVAYVAFWTTVSAFTVEQTREQWTKELPGLRDAWRAVAQAVKEQADG